MVNDAPTAIVHGHWGRVMGIVQGTVPREVTFRGRH
jgi:hypothetical protein